MSAGYEAMRGGAAWVEASARGRIRVTGEDRARLLHAMTTNDVQGLAPGAGCYAFFLNAQGRILADVNLFRLEDHILLDTEPETREKVYAHLDRFIIADDVTLEDLTESVAEIALEGPGSRAALEAMGAPVPDAPYSTAPWGSRTVARVSLAGGSGFLILAPAGERATLVGELERAGAVEATADELRTVRIENGKPRYGEEIGERFLAQETGQAHALNFHKGCYLGQEIVERVRSRAQIHRVLMPLRIETAEPPPAKTKLQAEGRDAAEIASAAYSPASGNTAALAYVRTEFATPGTRLWYGSAAAEVRAPPGG